MQPNISIDFAKGVVKVETDPPVEHALDTPEAFAAVSDAWLRAGWDTKYVYSFAWMGRPVIQLPDDMIRIQEVIFNLKPDVIIETGIAHGGSLIFYASLCKAMEKGKVVGVDIEIRPHNRTAIEEHFLYPYIEMIEADSAAASTIEQVATHVKPTDTTLIILDSCHTKEHVLKELEAYAPLCSVGSYIVATDGIMGLVAGGPRTEEDWDKNNPEEAALEFVANNPNFIIEEPEFPFNEGVVQDRVTYWPNAYVKRIA